MTSQNLNLGLATSGKPFCLPLEAITQTFAILAGPRGGENDDSRWHGLIETEGESVHLRQI